MQLEKQEHMKGLHEQRSQLYLHCPRHLASLKIKRQRKMEIGMFERWEDTNSLIKRQNELGHEQWRNKIGNMMIEYIIGKDALILNRIHEHFEKYEMMETTSLIELACWKVKLFDGFAFSTMQDVDNYKTLENGFNPIAYKEECRIFSGSEVIIPNVLEFLK